jgi:hypothetical protein
MDIIVKERLIGKASIFIGRFSAATNLVFRLIRYPTTSRMSAVRAVNRESEYNGRGW